MLSLVEGYNGILFYVWRYTLMLSSVEGYSIILLFLGGRYNVMLSSVEGYNVIFFSRQIQC